MEELKWEVVVQNWLSPGVNCEQEAEGVIYCLNFYTTFGVCFLVQIGLLWTE